jgi:DNA-binding GntR family transcriptional regulator
MFDQADSQSPQQLRDWVEEQLREAILSGEFDPGTWLRQQQLADELGVSQMPVREALKELVAQGLAEHIPYRGVRVIEFSIDDVADLYTHRSFLEGLTARAAAESITPEMVAELEDLQDQMEAHLAPEDLDVYRELNRRFHDVIFAASRRPYLIRALRQLWEAFPTMLWSKFPTVASCAFPERDENDCQEHRAILAALRSGDPDQAERAVRHHIETAGAQLVSFLRIGE